MSIRIAIRSCNPCDSIDINTKNPKSTPISHKSGEQTYNMSSPFESEEYYLTSDEVNCMLNSIANNRPSQTYKIYDHKQFGLPLPLVPNPSVKKA